MISIVMPVYNAGSYLEETIQSVLTQTYEEWELLIIDDCSNDGSYDVALAYAKKDDRIHLHRMEKNSGGPAAPRNYGVELSQGEYIAFLDADDVWYPHKLNIQLSYLMDEKKGFTSAKAYFIDEESKSINSSKSRIDKWLKFRKRKETLSDILRDNFIVTSSVLIKKELFKPFREDRELIAVEDIFLWLELFHLYPNTYLFQNEELLDYRVLENSISTRGESEKQNTKMLFAIMKFLLEYNLTYMLDDLRWSMCRRQIKKMIPFV